MRKIVTATFAAAVLGSAFAPVQAAPLPGPGPLAREAATPLAEKVQYAYPYGGPVVVERRVYRPYRPYYGPRYGYRPRYDRGAGVAAGVAGLAAGALIGGAIASSQAQAQPLHRTQDPGFIAACSRRYRSFDPATGTYLGRDGMRRLCEYPF